MREILFRGKTVNRRDVEWIEGTLVRGIAGYDRRPVFFIYTLDTKIDGRGYIDNYWGEEVDPRTVGQWTGLLDENGKKIFEGDIISELWEWREKGEENYYIVRWDNGSCGFEPFSDSLKNCGHCGGGINPKECEVIGNIHDNPELMKDNETACMDHMKNYMKAMTEEFMKSRT